jgi:hypothetical protein
MARQSDGKAVVSLRSADAGGSCGFCGEFTQNVVISDNLFGGLYGTTVSLVGTGSSTDTAKGRDIVVERNYFYSAAPGGVNNALLIKNTDGATVRSNVANLDGQATYTAYESSGASTSGSQATRMLRLLNNTCYTREAQSGQLKCIDSDGGVASTSVAKNNLLVAPNAGNPMMFAGSTPATNCCNVSTTQIPFVSSSPSGPQDFRITASNVAIDKGARVAAYQDWSMAKRPASGPFDAGAWESTSGTASGPPPAPVLLAQ